MTSPEHETLEYPRIVVHRDLVVRNRADLALYLAATRALMEAVDNIDMDSVPSTQRAWVAANQYDAMAYLRTLSGPLETKRYEWNLGERAIRHVPPASREAAMQRIRNNSVAGEGYGTGLAALWNYGYIRGVSTNAYDLMLADSYRQMASAPAQGPNLNGYSGASQGPYAAQSANPASSAAQSRSSTPPRPTSTEPFPQFDENTAQSYARQEMANQGGRSNPNGRRHFFTR